MSAGISPCQSCGACCATYRVTLPECELDESPGGHVPTGLTEPWTSGTACMRGTGAQPPRCIALRGEIGREVACRIYESRPDACREFGALAAVGRGDDACDDARRRHGLPPL